MSPETHIRANASKLFGCVRTRKGEEKGNIPKEDKETKNDVVFP
jgi:hypothetical protein